MKAAFIERQGGADVIRYGDLPRPEPSAGQVLVRVSAVTVDHVDTYIRGGAVHSPTPFPFVIGRDMTGVVETASPDVHGFRRGDRVWSCCLGIDGLQGAFAEYVAAPAARLYRLPDGCDPVRTVAVLHSALTAVTGLYEKAHVEAGDTVFVRGGSGNVGTAVTQIAAALGARVAATAGSAEKAAWCRASGAELAIDYHSDDETAALHAFAPDGVSVYWDTTRSFDMARALGALSNRGRIVVVAGIDRRCELPVGPFFLRNATLCGFTVTGTTTEEYARHAGRINGWLSKGTLRARIDRVLPLSEAAAAHRIVEADGVFGKVVLVPAA